ncbi:unnamed protein product [Lupinus luteus]|uniref:VQ domain-containing protein n=1 Tax=Lupinus luteus TaxID=3873 RepID=A0AAV1WI44_LUPLU
MGSNSSATTNLYGSDQTTPNTTFIQADPSNFRAVVQKLTGSSDDPFTQKLHFQSPLAQAHRPTTTAHDIALKKPNFKLHERRANKKLQLNIGMNNHVVGSGRGVFYLGEMVNVMASPASPLEMLARGSPRTPRSPQEEEEQQRVVVEKGFYLHPISPLNTPTSSQTPKLLPLFPLHSPNSHHS